MSVHGPHYLARKNIIFYKWYFEFYLLYLIFQARSVELRLKLHEIAHFLKENDCKELKSGSKRKCENHQTRGYSKVLGFFSQKISDPTELDEIRTGIHSKFE